jgi:hypothetical protein
VSTVMSFSSGSTASASNSSVPVSNALRFSDDVLSLTEDQSTERLKTVEAITSIDGGPNKKLKCMSSVGFSNFSNW